MEFCKKSLVLSTISQSHRKMFVQKLLAGVRHTFKVGKLISRFVFKFFFIQGLKKELLVECCVVPKEACPNCTSSRDLCGKSYAKKGHHSCQMLCNPCA